MKRISLIIALTLIISILAGCAGEEASTAAPAKSEPVETVAEEPEESLVSKYPSFKVTSENLNNGVWDDCISNTKKGENVSPQLSWEPVEGAEMYFVYMVDTSMQDWIHWKSDYITETSIPKGFASENEYIGPYPPEGGEHTYEIYVLAIKKPLERIKGSLNGQNMKFAKFIDDADTDAEGNSGNVVGGAHLSGTFKN